MWKFVLKPTSFVCNSVFLRGSVVGKCEDGGLLEFGYLNSRSDCYLLSVPILGGLISLSLYFAHLTNRDSDNSLKDRYKEYKSLMSEYCDVQHAVSIQSHENYCCFSSSAFSVYLNKCLIFSFYIIWNCIFSTSYTIKSKVKGLDDFLWFMIYCLFLLKPSSCIAKVC